MSLRVARGTEAPQANVTPGTTHPLRHLASPQGLHGTDSPAARTLIAMTLKENALLTGPL